MNKFILIVSLIILLALAGFFAYPHIKSLIAPMVPTAQIETTWQEFLATHEITESTPDIKIVITKDNRRLYLLSGDELVESWDVALGNNPEGPKSLANDGKTPVGHYQVVRRDRRARHHLGLYINYPCLEDANIALKEELITERQHREILLNSNTGLLPPNDTPLGGGVSIHGGGTSRDWTDGSVAVDDDVIEILWMACPKGTEVSIYGIFTDWELSDTMLIY